MGMLTAKIVADDQMREFADTVWNAFYGDVHQDDLIVELAQLDPGRTHGIYDGPTMIGGGAMLVCDMTLPGVGPSPIGAVTFVGVAPDQRRRGALTMLMRAELHGLHEGTCGNEPVAALWASEGGIYGRFGYGLASRRARLTVPRGAALRSDVDAGTERVAVMDVEAAGQAMRKLHGEYASGRIGGLSRTDRSWDWLLRDEERNRGGASAYRVAVVSGGYARFRVKENWEPRHGPEHEVRVQELVSLTPTTHAALWRFLAHLDLVGSVTYGNAPTDDPLPFMLDNPRQAATELGDALYVRLVDVDRALRTRRYATPLDVVFQVSDTFCPWNDGRWRLTADASGAAAVERTDADADLECGIAELGAAYLGSTRLTTLAAAGRVRELRPGALRAASDAFAAEHEPHCLEVF